MKRYGNYEEDCPISIVSESNLTFFAICSESSGVLRPEVDEDSSSFWSLGSGKVEEESPLLLWVWLSLWLLLLWLLLLLLLATNWRGWTTLSTSCFLFSLTRFSNYQ